MRLDTSSSQRGWHSSHRGGPRWVDAEMCASDIFPVQISLSQRFVLFPAYFLKFYFNSWLWSVFLPVNVISCQILPLLLKKARDLLKLHITDGHKGEKLLPEVITGWYETSQGRAGKCVWLMCACLPILILWQGHTHSIVSPNKTLIVIRPCRMTHRYWRMCVCARVHE